MTPNEWTAYDGDAAEDCGTLGRGAAMMGCEGGRRGGGGSHVSQISSACCLRNGCFLEPLRDVRGVCVCVCSRGLAQIYTFIPSLSLSLSSVNTLISNVSQSCCVLFSVIFRISVRFHVGFDLFPALFRLAASQDGQLYIFSCFVLVLRIGVRSSALASNRCVLAVMRLRDGV